MKATILLLICFTLGLPFTRAQIRVYKATGSIPRKVMKQSGYQYALPFTILTVDVPVTKVEWTPSSDCFDEKLTTDRLNDLVALGKVGGYMTQMKAGKSIVFFKLGDLALSSYPVADTSKLYWVSGRKNALKKQKLGISMQPDGRLNGAQTTFQDRTLEVVGSLTKVAGSVAGFLKAPSTAGRSFTGNDCDELKKKYDDITNAINSLLKSNMAQAVSAQLPELRKIQATLLERLTFTEEKTAYTIRRDIVINQGNEGANIALFTFSPTNGVAVTYPQATYPGSRFYLDYAGKNTGAIIGAGDAVDYTINVTFQLLHSRYNVKAPNEAIFTVKDGFRYNRPALTKVALKKNGSPILIENILLPQLGRIGTLPTRLSEMQFTLDPATGALLTVNQAMESISPEAISGLSDSVSSFTTLKTSELQRLTDDAGKMEQKVKLLKAQKEYEELIKAQKTPDN